MNSYNENLHSTVVAALQAQELDAANMQAKCEASMFTLYFAGGAKITAAERLKKAEGDYNFEKALKEQAVLNKNISVNLSGSANQQKTYVAQCVTNTAVAAANIQAATNAVVRLAADMSSIFSIVNAADFGTEIYTQSASAQSLMNDTAYDAESVSQLSMEASMLVSEVSSTTIADEAKAANTGVLNMFSIISADYDLYSAAVNADHETLTEASATEKAAEGNLEFINVETFAAQKAYELNNKELNLDLKVPLKDVSQASYTVKFNCFESAFPKPVKPGKGASQSADDKDVPYSPVETYYIMLSKNNKKTLFSLQNAENLVFSGMTNCYVAVDGTNPPHSSDSVEKHLNISSMNDTDGDPMKSGTEYVVFVLAAFTMEYKKTLNVFTDYLSAPSGTFCLTDKLTSPAAAKILVTPDGIHQKPKDVPQVLTFELAAGANPDVVDYRCMFLPVTQSYVKGMLSGKGLKTMESEVKKLEKIAEKYDPQIEQLQEDIATLNAKNAETTSKIQVLDVKIAEVEKEIKETPPKDRKKLQELHDQLTLLEKQRTEQIHKQADLGTKIKASQATLKKLESDKDRDIASVDPSVDSDPGFFFNLELAEQVPYSSYTKVDVEPVKETKSVKGTMTLTNTLLDNFGNVLVEGNEYIPLVLTIANSEQEMEQFTNSISKYEDTKKFVYLGVNN